MPDANIANNISMVARKRPISLAEVRKEKKDLDLSIIRVPFGYCFAGCLLDLLRVIENKLIILIATVETYGLPYLPFCICDWVPKFFILLPSQQVNLNQDFIQHR